MSDDGPGTREVAYRPFAAEFDDASLSYSESDEERAPNYVVTPTGARINRLFAVGVLTEVERVNEETRRGRIVDPSGAFITYAGQYQPEAQTFLERADPPAFVALTGKARTFEPEDSDRVFTSVRPESLNEVDADTRDRWVVAAAESTLDRLAVFRLAQRSSLCGEELRTALEAGGAPASLAAGIPRALDHYDTTPAYVEAIRRLAVDALELIAGDREEVRRPDIAPGEGGVVEVGPLPETDVTIEVDVETGVDAEPGTAADVDAGTVAEHGTEADVDTGTAATPEPATGSGTSAETEPDVSASAVAGTSEKPESTVDSGATSPDDGGESIDVASESQTTEEAAGGLGDFDDGSEEFSDTVDDAPDIEDTSDIEDAPDVDDTLEEGIDDTLETEATDEMYELDDEERAEIESEFGTEFSTGSEVDEPGSADIDVPEPATADEQDPTTTDEPEPTETSAPEPTATDELTGSDADEPAIDDVEASTAESSTAESSASESDTAEADSGQTDDIDLEDAVIEAMTALDDGDGAPEEAVTDRVVSAHGVDADAVADAIEDALMSGKCYEPNDGVLKPI